MAFITAKLKNKIAYFNKLAEKLVTGQSTNSQLLTSNNKWVAREMDKVEGMFLITECKYRKSDRVEDHMVHKCKHTKNYSSAKDCKIKYCPL